MLTVCSMFKILHNTFYNEYVITTRKCIIMIMRCFYDIDIEAFVIRELLTPVKPQALPQKVWMKPEHPPGSQQSRHLLLAREQACELVDNMNLWKCEW